MENRITLKPNSTREEIIAFKKGALYGMWCYAYWKDGTQFVGNCGKTLKEAETLLERQMSTLLEGK